MGAALSIYLEHMAKTLRSREQLAIQEFAQALTIIPKTLALNGALDATDIVAKLRGYHSIAQNEDSRRKYRWIGLDLENGKMRDNVKAGVLEPAMSKKNPLSLQPKLLSRFSGLMMQLKWHQKKIPKICKATN